MRILMNKEVLVLASRWLIATLLVYAVVQFFNINKGFFSLITIAAIIQLMPADTFIRSVMRLAATLVSAFLTYFLLNIAHHHLFILIPGCLIITFFAGYAIFQSEVTRYFHIMLGIIMVNVLYFSTLTTSHLSAVIEIIKLVSLGVACMLITEVCVCFFTRQALFSRTVIRDFIVMFTSFVDKEERRSRALVALQLCIAVALTLTPWLVFHYYDVFWMVISCFFVVEEYLSVVQLRSKYRFFAHLVSAIVGGIIVLLSVYWPEIRMPLFLLCIFMICVFMVTKKELALVGNTMGIALIIMVLGGDDRNVIYRFAYTTIGIIVGLAVCTVFAKTQLFLKHHYVKNSP